MITSKPNPLVSIIIPVNTINDFIREAVPKHLEQSYKNLEVLILPDEMFDDPLAGGQERSTSQTEKVRPPETEPASRLRQEDWLSLPVRVIPTGKVSPAEKRDLALRYAWGEFLAFIDDDAYPDRQWLEKALPWFEDPEVAAVCGPGVTPPNDSWWQKAGGWVCASPLGGGGSDRGRFLPGRTVREVDDWPSMNLIVRREDFAAVGGFDNQFWPGEDTKLCLDLTHKLGKKIIYDPEVLVYHHRRALFGPHLKQHGRYGLHRGHFARVLPETSRRMGYFGPAGLVLYLGVIGLMGLMGRIGLPGLFLPLAIYGLLLILNALWVWSKSGEVRTALLSVPGVFATHIWYGVRFIQGFLVGKIR